MLAKHGRTPNHAPDKMDASQYVPYEQPNTLAWHVPGATPPPALNLFAQVRYNCAPDPDALWWVQEARPRYDCQAVVTPLDFGDDGVTVPARTLVFKDYVYRIWRFNGGREDWTETYEHRLEVVHNEPTLAAAVALIKGGPNDPVQTCGLMPVRNSNLDHNPHMALLHLYNLAALESDPRGGTDMVQELRRKWNQCEVTPSFLEERPDVATGDSDAEDSEEDMGEEDDEVGGEDMDNEDEDSDDGEEEEVIPTAVVRAVVLGKRSAAEL